MYDVKTWPQLKVFYWKLKLLKKKRFLLYQHICTVKILCSFWRVRTYFAFLIHIFVLQSIHNHIKLFTFYKVVSKTIRDTIFFKYFKWKTLYIKTIIDVCMILPYSFVTSMHHELLCCWQKRYKSNSRLNIKKILICTP